MKAPENPNTNLNDLIQKIKSEGIREAEKKAEEILAEAKVTASKILNEARHEANDITEKAGEEVKRKELHSKKALEQAARDILLTVRKFLTELFDSLIKREFKNVLTEKTLETVLIKMIDGWQRDKDDDLNLELFLCESDRHMLLEGFIERFQDEIKSGIELKVHPNIESGFRIGVKESHVTYDFTDEGLADVLSEYLNPRFYTFLDSLKRGNQE
ncbi:MAG: hypothetical protein D8M57_18780 [Candidatus Scalindua sp. AMX11]|nr:MAG: hypothetical protein DWQ00_18075 [Candidatus Scalindua sp.]NOG83080.1 hypothetical protein [Planctomycetota bacterium]RZV63114.1 MAG: hypothetical protein EX341_18440 [Candidatus Scalindua sp. SCAELEC01]TDE63356.1 MAG: hypothetical protein D8M57_18780 [Candidatus Scalindua sp. AMX11]GJQ57373.1 MAG: V-type ATP synthase subunit E [Candidatus Scalindua sp.]